MAYNAYTGVDQFKDKPAKNLRFIASLYPETIQIVARADSGIKTVKDIKGKRLVPGDRGSGTEVDSLNVLGIYGYTYKDFAGVDWLGLLRRGPTAPGQAGRRDLHDGWLADCGHPGAGHLAKIALVPIDEAKIKELTKKYPFYSRIIIPKGTYKDQDKDVATITTMAQWVVGAEVPEEVVYKLTKAFWETGAAKMANAHAQGKNVQIEDGPGRHGRSAPPGCGKVL